ncbi:MAG: hypothetical protein RSB91_05485 [Clostridia bacterium]
MGASRPPTPAPMGRAFDECLWNATVESLMVESDGTLVFQA